MALEQHARDLEQLTDRDLARLREEIRAAVQRRVPVQPPLVLFHYTSSRALVEIEDSQVLWLSHAAYLNDSSEIEYGLSVVENALNSLPKQFETIRASFRSLYRYYFEPYVFSLSEDSDSLAQWRAYGREGPVAIGFDTQQLRRFTLDDPTAFNYTSLSHVVYDRNIQMAIIRDVIDAIAAFDKERKQTTPFGTVFMFLKELIPTFKHRTFSEEKEWRMIRVMVPNVPSDAEHIRHCYRTGLIIPYIKLRPPEQERIRIAQVVCGPNPSSELLAEGVQSMLVKKGSKPNVTVSQVPYRTSW